jgi:hypothetical protein
MLGRLPVTLCLLALGSGAATAAPPQLLDKAVTVSFTISVDARAEDGSGTAARPRHVERVIYVSTKGRLFTRVSRQVGQRNETRERGPETTAGAFRFQGNTLVGVLAMPSGASQLTVTFDPGFSGCSASVVMGRDSGKAIRFKGLDGRMYTVAGKPTISSPSCSMRSGNPFG